MIRPSGATLQRFAVLLGLSVVVAAVGLLQNSTAVVIGAMMIAPLMAPIMGIAASLVMGWGARLVSGLVIVSGSVVGSVLLAWAIAAFLPEVDTGLPAEVLSRSSPDVRDLLVALAAGAAGAFATVRRDVSGALPGVAVAVALVPPLASVGVLLGRDQPDLARGAMLLFVTNLFGIVLAAAIIFVLTGFVPVHRIKASPRQVAITLGLATVPTIVVGVILTARFIATADHARELRLATRTVVQWLGTGDDLNRVTLTGTTVQANITGESSPPQVQTLTDALTKALGHPVTVDLRWTPIRGGAETKAASPALALDALRPAVEQWLATQSLALDGLSYDGATLVVATSGGQPPRNGDELTALISHDYGYTIPVSLSWTRSAPNDVAASGDTVAATARTTAEKWAQTHAGTAVLAVDQSDTGVTVTIIGTAKPSIAQLQRDLSAALPQQSVTVQWVSGSILGRSLPAPLPSPSTTPSGTPQPSPSPSPTR